MAFNYKNSVKCKGCVNKINAGDTYYLVGGGQVITCESCAMNRGWNNVDKYLLSNIRKIWTLEDKDIEPFVFQKITSQPLCIQEKKIEVSVSTTPKRLFMSYHNPYKGNNVV